MTHGIERRLPALRSRLLLRAVLPGALVCIAACNGTAPPKHEGPPLPRPVASTPEQRRAERLIRSVFGQGDVTKKSTVRKWETARRELVAIGKPAVPFLVYGLYAGDAVERMNCQNTLVAIGPLAADDLSRALDCGDGETRRHAATALGRIRAGAPKAKLQEMATTDPAWMVRAAAAEALGNIVDRKSVPVLVRCLSDAHPHVRAYACIALGKIGDPAALRALERAMLSDEVGTVRDRAKAAQRRIVGMRPKTAAKP
jgi:HEAT repeat protein